MTEEIKAKTKHLLALKRERDQSTTSIDRRVELGILINRLETELTVHSNELFAARRDRKEAV